MQKYFFQVNGEADAEGTSFSDACAARGEAIKAFGEMVKDLDGALTGREWRMRVTDESGRQILLIRFEAQVDPPDEP